MKKGTICLVCLLLGCMLCSCSSKASRGVDSLIMAIGQVDADCGPVVEYVREQYEQLSEEDRNKLENYQVLLASEAAWVDAVIDSIGNVTADSGNAIAAAKNAYASIDQEAQVLVTGMEKLQEAEASCEHQIMLERLSGKWVNEVLGNRDHRIGRGLIHNYGLDETSGNPGDTTDSQFELLEDGSVLHGTEAAGSWTIAEDKNSVKLTMDGKTTDLVLMQEGGYWKLVGPVFGNAPFGYVKEQDYVSAFHEKYAAAELNQENIHTYLADPEPIGQIETGKGKTATAFWYGSRAYEEGLVYLGSSCVIPVAYDHGGRQYSFWLEFPMLSTSELKINAIRINTDAPISGEIYYVKEEYVAENFINEDGFRVLVLTNGVELIFNGYDDMMDTFWKLCDASYEDHKY